MIAPISWDHEFGWAVVSLKQTVEAMEVSHFLWPTFGFRWDKQTLSVLRIGIESSGRKLVNLVPRGKSRSIFMQDTSLNWGKIAGLVKQVGGIVKTYCEAPATISLMTGQISGPSFFKQTFWLIWIDEKNLSSVDRRIVWWKFLAHSGWESAGFVKHHCGKVVIWAGQPVSW